MSPNVCFSCQQNRVWNSWTSCRVRFAGGSKPRLNTKPMWFFWAWSVEFCVQSFHQSVPFSGCRICTKLVILVPSACSTTRDPSGFSTETTRSSRLSITWNKFTLRSGYFFNHRICFWAELKSVLPDWWWGLWPYGSEVGWWGHVWFQHCRCDFQLGL